MTRKPLPRDRILGEALQRLRIERGLDRRAVADATKISQRDLAAYERGDQSVPALRLGQLCELYAAAIVDTVDAARQLSPDETPPVRFDFEGLSRGKSADVQATARLVEAIASRRSTVRPSDGSIAIRTDDLVVISAALGSTVDRLTERLRAEGLLRNPVGRPPGSSSATKRAAAKRTASNRSSSRARRT